MKIGKDQKFQPVVITLESQLEVTRLYNALMRYSMDYQNTEPHNSRWARDVGNLIREEQ